MMLNHRGSCFLVLSLLVLCPACDSRSPEDDSTPPESPQTIAPKQEAAEDGGETRTTISLAELLAEGVPPNQNVIVTFTGPKVVGERPDHKDIDLGLDWLKRHQDPGGFWSSAGFSGMCGEKACDGTGDGVHDVGVTGLALLAFLGAGHTPDHDRYGDVIKNGIEYLLGIQDEESGCFGEVNSHQAFLYDHSLATLAVTEAYGILSSPDLKEPAQRGINFIHATRNPYRAWRYSFPPIGDNDMSITGWMVMCLKSAQDFGLEVDEDALKGAMNFMDDMTDESTWRTGYLARGGYSARDVDLHDRWPPTSTEAITALAMLCRVLMGQDPEDEPALRGGANLLLKNLPMWDEKAGSIDIYYWYYGSAAMFQMGGPDWKTWSQKMFDAVARTQRQEGCERGSWDPQFDPWGHRGGRVYSTAVMTLCLEIFYRYDHLVGGR